MTVSRLQRGAGRLWWERRFVGEAVDARPERAARAGSTHRIVNPLFVRTTDDAVVGDGLLRTLLPDKARDVGGNRRIMTHVNRLRRPRSDSGRTAPARSLDYGDDELGG